MNCLIYKVEWKSVQILFKLSYQECDKLPGKNNVLLEEHKGIIPEIIMIIIPSFPVNEMGWFTRHHYGSNLGWERKKCQNLKDCPVMQLKKLQKFFRQVLSGVISLDRYF